MEKVNIGACDLYHGDCIEALRAMPDNSIDSVCTDPPYGLSDHKPDEVLACLTAWLAGETYRPKGRGFMGKSWDAWVPGPEVWREVLRVLKPGGHMLVFAGTRSMDLMSMAVRLAGFELRDSIGYAHDGGDPTQAPVMAWVTGSGFPKAEAWTHEKAGKGNEESAAMVAAGFEGWARGSALKPAWEPIVLARKPLIGKVDENVLKFGVGAINVDGCRVGDFVNTTPSGVDRRNAKLAEMGYRPSAYQMGDTIPSGAPGRWPANLIHDGSEDVLQAFPNAPGQQGHLKGHTNDRKSPNGCFGKMAPAKDHAARGDAGSAARFFYCAKASQKDRNEGLDDALAAKPGHPTVKPTALMQYLVRLVTPPGGVVLDPFMGSGSTGKAAAYEGFNFIGVEREREYFDIACVRIAAAMEQGRLFDEPAQGGLAL